MRRCAALSHSPLVLRLGDLNRPENSEDLTTQDTWAMKTNKGYPAEVRERAIGLSTRNTNDTNNSIKTSPGFPRLFRERCAARSPSRLGTSQHRTHRGLLFPPVRTPRRPAQSARENAPRGYLYPQHEPPVISSQPTRTPRRPPVRLQRVPNPLGRTPWRSPNGPSMDRRSVWALGPKQSANPLASATLRPPPKPANVQDL